ncbi:universal stress protein [Modestobacter sp. SSW1-42]|uniref:universal stress protein n=1 Tax=Modestobacter sp. SSW1-42 TaxID=596372 RepID=UPI003988610A
MDEATGTTDRPDTEQAVAVGRTVVVGVDGSPGGRAALVWALTEAARREAPLQVVSAFPVDFYWTDPYLLDRRRIDQLEADTRMRARALVDEVRADPAVTAVPGTGAVPVEVTVVPGPPAEHLVRLAQDAALLVVGSRGRGGVRSAVLGSVALHCSTHAVCPVVVVHPQETAGPARVVVGVDGSATARTALAHAAQAAAERGAELEVVAAYLMPTYWSEVYVLLTESLDEMREKARVKAQETVTEVLGAEPGVPVTVVALEGPARDALLQRAAGAQLLVVGSRSRSQLPGMVLGSVALHCVVHAPCPVMVVHPQRRPVQQPAPALASAGA